MEKFVIMGGRKLAGTIRVSGAKNAALPILAATLLTGTVSVLHEVPLLKDVQCMLELLQYLGAKVTVQGKTVTIDTSTATNQRVSEELMRKMRASNLVLGPLLSRFHCAKVSYPGGCAIGSRPMDLHLKGFRQMGAEITEKYGYIMARASGGLRGAEIHLDFPSVGATENIMMAAVLARGRTIIRNPAREPEIVDLQNYLNLAGAKIKGAGTDIIKIDGVEELKPVEHTIIPDRIEAGTHMVAAAVTRGDVTLTNVIPEHLEAVTAKLREAGVTVETGDDWIRVRGGEELRAVDIKTLPYPGFPTDMQAQMMVLAAVGRGTSIISESIFENRFKHVDELRRMGADIKIEGRVAVVKGVPRLSGAYLEASDLRAGAALVIAGLAAEDVTVIENIEHIDRGYENLEHKYSALGARIIRVNGGEGYFDKR